jgi:hypothetical protein
MWLLLALACGEDEAPLTGTPGDADGDGWLDEQDCAPDDASVNPEAEEVCDGIDNNCNGTIDGVSEAVDPPEWYIDADGDGYGLEEGARARGCDQPSGFAARYGDCDDFDPEANPETVWYFDVDGDGYGDASIDTVSCEAPGDDWVLNGEDCYDGSAEIHPGADEYCDGVDTDCDGELDEGEAIDAKAWYEDADGDGYGGEDTLIWSCEAPAGYGAEGGDCDDTDDTVHPYSTQREIPFDGVDNDCDGVDYCTDLDCDGYADLVVPIQYDGGYPNDSNLFFGRDGYISSSSKTLETGYARAAASADLDGDGYQDVVFANYDGVDSYQTPSVIYWGSDGGPKGSAATELMTEGVMDVLIEDFDLDGYPDIAFGTYYDGSGYEGGHLVYWGPDFSEDERTELQGGGSQNILTSDLDGDGYLELIACSYRDSSDYVSDTNIFWGGVTGFSSEEVLTIQTTGCMDAHAEDLNRDGYADLVVASHYTGSSYSTTSVVYWGSELGPTSAYRDELPTYGARDVEVADVDQDGWKDLVFGGYRAGTSWSTTAYTTVYYGSSLGYSDEVVDRLTTKGVMDFELVDLDDDGWLELVTPTYYDGSSYTASSTIWWGSEGGWTEEDSSSLQTYGAAAVRAADLDGDGGQELVFSGYYKGNWNNEAPTVVFWSHDGWTEGEELDTWGNYGPVLIVTREPSLSL